MIIGKFRREKPLYRLRQLCLTLDLDFLQPFEYFPQFFAQSAVFHVGVFLFQYVYDTPAQIADRLIQFFILQGQA